MKKDRKAKIPLASVIAKAGNRGHSALKLNANHQQLINRYLGIVECSLEGKHINFNDEFCQIMGYERDELLQLGIKDVTHEDDYHIDIKLHSQLIADEIPYYKIEKRYMRKDGQVVWADVTRSIVRNPRGKALYTIGTVLDITERHAAEEALLVARTKAERTTRRLARLQQITAALTGSATTQQLAEMILEQGTQAAGAAAGILVELLDNGREIRTIAALGYPAAAVRTEPAPLSASTPMSDCILTKKAVWIGSHEEFAVQYPEIARLRGGFGNEATVALPLIVGDQVLGGLAFSFVEPRTFDAEEGEFFLAVAQQCAQALERARSEDALRESERKFSLIYDKLPFAATLSSPLDGAFLDVNESFEKIFGFTKEEVIGKTSLELGINSDAESRQRILAELQEKNSVRGIELELFTRSKGARIFLINLDLVEIRGEKHILQTAQDTSERKKTENELRARVEEIEALFQVAPIGIFIAQDPACTRIIGNPEGYRSLGLPQDSAANVSKSAPPEERPSYRVFRNGEELANDDLPMQAAARLGRAVKEESMELRFSDGSHKYLYAYAKPLFGEDGKVRGAIAAMLDITARKQIEEALRESEEQFRAILNQATAGIVRKSIDGTFLFVNEAFCEMLNYSSSDLAGKSIWQLTHQDDVGENKRLFERLMEYGIPFQLERRLIRRDGSILWSNVSVSPILDASGKPLSAVGVEVDVTGRKQAEEALYTLNLELENRVEERTEELKTTNQALLESRRRLQVLSQRLVAVQEEERRLLAQELHDRVGQSLIALKLNLTIVQNQLSEQNTEQLGVRLADSITLVTEVIGLVRDVMSNLRPNSLDDHGLEAALQEYLNEFHSRYGIQIRFEKSGSRIPRLDSSIEMTVLRITQEALTNIARHAQAELVVLTLHLDAKEVCLTIEDNGVGMASVQDAGRPDSRGLKIMRERAEALEGNLSIRSSLGKGTTIEAIIPLPVGDR